MKIWITFASLCLAHGFVVPSFQSTSPTTVLTSPTVGRTELQQSNRWDQEIDENSRRKAAGGAGETIAGAVLGGLIAGPFGALFGASVGSSFGAKNAVDRARQDEMKRLGLSQDMLDSAQQVGLALEQCMQGLQQVQESLQTQQRLARRLDADSEALYEKAKAAMARNDEEDARKCLLERERVRDHLKEVLGNCVTAKQQVAKMEENAAGLERRAMEIEALLQRTVGATAMQNTEDLGLSLSDSDPLLRKFKDLGID